MRKKKSRKLFVKKIKFIREHPTLGNGTIELENGFIEIDDGLCIYDLDHEIFIPHNLENHELEIIVKSKFKLPNEEV